MRSLRSCFISGALLSCLIALVVIALFVDRRLEAFSLFAIGASLSVINISGWTVIVRALIMSSGGGRELAFVVIALKALLILVLLLVAWSLPPRVLLQLFFGFMAAFFSGVLLYGIRYRGAVLGP